MKVTSLRKHYKVNDSTAQLDILPTNNDHIFLHQHFILLKDWTKILILQQLLTNELNTFLGKLVNIWLLIKITIN